MENNELIPKKDLVRGLEMSIKHFSTNAPYPEGEKDHIDHQNAIQNLYDILDSLKIQADCD